VGTVWAWGVGRLPDAEAADAREASNRVRLDGEVGMGKEEGPPCRSSRLMSSKCERSCGPTMSERLEE
jgi:hypothetical protein